MNKVIKNCLITRSDASVLKEFCIDTSNPLYKIYKGFNTSVNLEATSVYNMYSGVVSVVCGDKRSGYEVGVLLNKTQAIKYGNLKSVDVNEGQYVDVSTKIGDANKYVKIEYMTVNTRTPFTYRIGSVLMYKDDPMKILDSNSNLVKDSLRQYDESGLIGVLDFYDQGLNPSMVFMLSDNRGDR